MSKQRLIEELSEEYDQMQEEISEMIKSVKQKHRAEEKAEIDMRKEELERAFAVKFELARTAGVKRFELELPVLKTKNGARYKHFVELGGGELTRLRTKEERAEDLQANREERTGVRQLGENRYMLALSTGGEVEVYIRQDNDGRHLIWADGEGITALQEEFNKSKEALYSKGAEIVAAFGLDKE